MAARPIKYSLDLLESYRHLADAQIHPDGSCVAFVCGDLTHQRGRNERANIYLVSTGGSAPQPFTTADACEMHPRWSPDGSTLAFISDRSGYDDFQVYLMPRRGGEAEQLTDGARVNEPYRDVSMFKWSPDGSRIAFLQKEPEPPARTDRVAEGYDEIRFEAEPRFTRVCIVDVAARKTHVVTRGDVQVWEFDWSPDGNELVLGCSAQPFEWSWYDSWLARVSAQGGVPRKIFERKQRQLAHPRWSPDGHHIGFVASLWSDRGIICGDLYLTDKNGKNMRILSEGYAGSIAGVEWTDNQTLTTAGYLEGEAAITEFDVEGVSRNLWRGPGALHEGFSPKFSTTSEGIIAVVRSAPDMPPEVWTLDPTDPDANVWQQLTALNKGVQNIPTGEHEVVHWTSTDGTRIQGVLVKPVGPKKGIPLPLIVHPHGGPTGITANDYLSPTRWVYHLTQRGYAVFMPNYRGSVGWGIEFAEANLGDMGGRDFEDIMSGVDALVERGIADPKRMGFGGHSYGGYLTALAITRTNRFKAAVAYAGIVNWLSFHGTSRIGHWDEIHFDARPYERGSVYDAFNPINRIDRVDTPTLILHGEKDGDVPVSQSIELYRAIQAHSIPTELVIYPREPHTVAETAHVKDLITRVCNWFDRHLKP